MSRLNLEADIEPGKGLGGLWLDQRAVDVQDELLGNVAHREFVSSLDLRFHLAGGEVEVGIDLRTGTIVRLTARDGYRGNLLGEVTVGMDLDKAMALEPRIRWQGGEKAEVAGVKGVEIEVRTVAGFKPKAVVDGIAVFLV